MTQETVFAPEAPLGRSRGALVPWIVAAVASAVAVVSLVAVVIGAAGGGTPEAKSETTIVEHGSSTPEAAVKLFAEAFAKGDMDTAASAFAVTSMVDGYSFTAWAEYMDSISPLTWLPTEDYPTIALAQRQGEVGMALNQLTRDALMPERDGTMPVVLSGDDVSVSDFVSGVDPSGFAGVSVKDITVFTFGEGTKAERNQLNASAPWGADSSRTASVLFDTPDGTKLLGVQVVEYGDNWYIWILTAPVLGTHINQMTPITWSDYAYMVSDIESRLGHA